MTDCDVVIAGGGIGGMTAAAVLGATGLEILCCDPKPANASCPRDADLRTSALFLSALRTLESAGITGSVESGATPIHTLRIVEAGEAGNKQPSQFVEFISEEIGEACLGWNVANTRLTSALAQKLATMQNIRITPVAVKSLLPRKKEILVTLANGERVRSKLLVGADGRNSAVRQAARIKTFSMSFGQSALAFYISHDIPHESMATEILLAGGPFTLVPMADYEGRPASAVVWIDSNRASRKLSGQSKKDFEEAAYFRSLALAGGIQLISGRSLWPVCCQIACRFSAERTVLIGEAAHILPPTGAQGLNTTFGDISALLEIVESSLDDPGRQEAVSSYHSRRLPEAAMRAAGTSLLNLAAMQDSRIPQRLRRLGLSMIHGIEPIRLALLRKGLGLAN